MRVHIDKDWTFIEAAKASWTYRGGGIQGAGWRLGVLRAWGCAVGKKRALQEFDKAVEEYGIEEITKALNIAPSSIKKLRKFYSNLPSETIELLRVLKATIKLDSPVDLEEDRQYEFKQVKGNNPVDSIKNTADEYAVAYLNSEGGSVLWGIRDSNRTVCGVKLNYQERDKLRREISQKLAVIQPAIDPTAYRIELHKVCDQKNEFIDDLYLIEMTVPASNSSRLHFTGGNETFVKVDGAKKKLTGPEIQDWIIRRLDINKEELQNQILILLGSWNAN
ncbi:ATP-binding protein [uncultured Nostoc sp.]|uniref:ATP-binding protein n=1 Tax=uncultured Nostoc sp. TaxID=340711 RepID=UPI0035C969F7